MAKVCIICEKEVASGALVEDDVVIRSIRRIKQSLRVAKNNELYVCAADMGAYAKKRQSYERKLALYFVIGGVVFLLLAVLPLFTFGFSLYSAFLGAAIGAFIVLLPVVTSHTPKLASGAAPAADGAKKAKGNKGRGKKR